MKRPGEIRMLSADDAREFAWMSHTGNADSGTEGAHFHPYPRDAPFEVDEITERAIKRWSTPLTEPQWLRTWGWWVEGELVGSVTLQCGEKVTEMHRANLGIGLLPRVRAQGGGSRLLTTAIVWARAQPTLGWIELGVFGDNPRARSLYERFGFVEFGRHVDRFRVDGAVLDNVMMSLYVGAGDAPSWGSGEPGSTDEG